MRQLQAESNQNVVFALDVGRGMRGESGGLTAIDHAINAALLTAEVALRAGDKAGLLAFDTAPRGFVAPTGGASGARKLTRAAFALEAGLAATDYGAAMAFLRNQVRARSLFVVFTNLLEPRSAADLAASLEGLAPRHVPLCVLLRDTDVEALATAPVRGTGDLYVRAAAADKAWLGLARRPGRETSPVQASTSSCSTSLPRGTRPSPRQTLPRRQGATPSLTERAAAVELISTAVR